jgi:hypothetical protein
MPEALLHNPEEVMLGKADAKPAHAMLEDFVDFERAYAEDPASANVINSVTTSGGHGQAVTLAMYLNAKLGCCTFSGIGNILRVDSSDATEISDEDVETGYIAVTTEEGNAYDPATGANADAGCAEIDVLDYCVKTGVGGNKILGHAAVNAANDKQRRQALYMCGPLYPGWQLSTDQQTQEIWAAGPAAAGSWGGHCAPISDEYTDLAAVGYVINGIQIPKNISEILALLTWGSYKLARGNYVPFACDELHALLTPAWLARNRNNPAVNVSAVESYFATLTKES